MFLHGANAAWNGGEKRITNDVLVIRNYHVRLIDNDAKITDYENLGTARNQIEVDSVE